MRFFRKLPDRPDRSLVTDPDAVLERLRAHSFLRRQRPLTDRPTFAEWLAMHEQDRSALYEPQIAAVRSVERADFEDIDASIRALGHARHEPAVPFLAELWRTCPVSPIRQAAGSALLEIRSPEALEVLWSTREDWDRFAAHLAVRAQLVTNPSGSFDLTEQLIDDARAGDANAGRLVNEILRLLAPWTQGHEGWTEPKAQDWLRDDERWLQLCVRLRSDPAFGEAARRVLRYQPRARVKSVLERQPKPTVPAVKPPRPSQPWLSRYRAGEFDIVWHELTDLGAIEEPEIRHEATLVADELMQRAAAAFEELRERLRRHDYPLEAEPAVDEEIEVRLRELARIARGPVPISIASFWRVVGAVDISPVEEADWPDWLPSDQRAQEKLDPFEIDALADVWFSVDEWLADRAKHLPEVVGPLEVTIGPDALHKVNVSGGPPYAIRMPDSAVDPPIRWLEGEPHLVPYLRQAITRGGFVGIDPAADLTPAWRAVVAALSQGLPRF